jgi:hypothetical protein
LRKSSPDDNEAWLPYQFFGSVLTPRFNDESDVDMPVEFESGRGSGLIGIAGMEIELSEMLGRKVDLPNAPGSEPVLPGMKSWLPPYRNMCEDDRVRLGHMLQSANEALFFADGRSQVDLDHDRMLLHATSGTLKSSVKRPLKYAGVQAAGIRSAMGPTSSGIPLGIWAGASAYPTIGQAKAPRRERLSHLGATW